MKTAKKGMTTFSFGPHGSFQSGRAIGPLLTKANILVLEAVSKNPAERRQFNRERQLLADGKARIKPEVLRQVLKNPLSYRSHMIGEAYEIQRRGRGLRVVAEPYSKKVAELSPTAEKIQGDTRDLFFSKATPENTRRLIEKIREHANFSAAETIERDKNLKRHIKTLRTQHPEANIVVKRGTVHTPLHINMKKEGENVERKVEAGTHIYGPRDRLMRQKVFEETGLLRKKMGAEQEEGLLKKEIIYEVVLGVLSERASKKMTEHEMDNYAGLVTNQITDKELNTLFERMKKNQNKAIVEHVLEWINENDILRRNAKKNKETMMRR